MQVTRTTKLEDLPQFLTLDELREYLCLGRSTVYDLIRRGTLPHVRFGTLIRVPREALRKQVEQAR